MKIRIGPAGCGVGLLNYADNLTGPYGGVRACSVLGLDAMEVEFVQGIKMSNEKAKQIGRLAKTLDIKLSVHAPYWINLASEDDAKISASVQRIMDSCERAHYLGVKDVVFHAAFYGKREKQKVHEMVRAAVVFMMDLIRMNEWNVQLAPEVMGKTFTWGSVEEVIELVKETNCSFCIDFAHVYARNLGVVNWSEVFDKICEINPQHIHSHFSNIEFTSKGERRHLVLDSQPPFKPLAEEILKRQIDITMICESPITWKDSIKMKNIFISEGMDKNGNYEEKRD